MKATLDYALNYHARGWMPIPVPPRSKNPGRKGWQKERWTRDDLPRCFNNGQNVGLLLGKPSNGLTDIDLDWREARFLADRFLPKTGLRSGRESDIDSHLWLNAIDDVKTTQFKDPTLTDTDERNMIIEIRSTGGQTIVAPSIHPSGEQYIWTEFNEPAKIDAKSLLKIVARLAACALLARHWQNGQRHDTALALSGVLLRAGWSIADVEHFIVSAAMAANDEEAQDRAKNVITTQQRLSTGETATGLPKLAELLGDKIVEKLRLWLKLPSLPIQKKESSTKLDAQTADRQRLKVTCLADVEPEQVEYLWYPYIPKGKLTFIEGDPGVGKSWLTCALAAATAAGKGIVGWKHNEPSNVLILSAEDGLGDTIRPRLDSMDADVTRIFAIEGAFVFNQTGLLGLEAKIIEYKPALVIIDPIVAYLGAGVDMHRANETRAITSPLADLALKYGCAIVIVRHLTKGGKDKAIYRGLGTIDFTASCRSALLVGFNPEDNSKRVIVHIKSNLAEPGVSIEYEIRDGVFLWAGESSLTAEQILSANGAGDSAEAKEAEDFLKQVLADGEMPSREVLKEARSVGITDWQVRIARKKLCIQPKKKGQPGQKGQCWMWALPCKPEDEDIADFLPEDVKENESTHLRANGDDKNLYSSNLVEDEAQSFSTQLREDPAHLRGEITSCLADGFEGVRYTYCQKCGEFLR